MTPFQWIKFFSLRDEWVLNQKIKSVKQDMQERIRKHFERSDDDGFYPPKNDESLELIKEIGRNALSSLERQLNKLRADRKFYGKPNPENVITADMIQKAKEFPLNQIIEINRQGFAKCIWHEDKNPSMFCKKNFAHCFTCDNSGDTIAVLMKRKNMGFREAVLKLQ